MDIKQLLISPDTKLIYDNYNKTYLYKREIIIKYFSENKRLLKEINIINSLKQIKNPYIQEIIEIFPPYIAFKFIDESTFSSRVRKSNISVKELINSLFLLPRNIPNFKDNRNENTTSKWMLSNIEKLFNEKVLNSTYVNLLEEIVSSYSLSKTQFIHGDLRPDNIIGNGIIKCFIDWEYAGYGDFNKDIAYLYWGTIMKNPNYKEELLKEIKTLPELNINVLIFYLLRIYLSCLNNPKTDKNMFSNELIRFINFDIQEIKSCVSRRSKVFQHS